MTKQYELVWIGGTESEMQESAYGDWVKTEDYDALQSLNAELLEALEYALPYLEACVPSPRNGINPDCSVDVNCVDRARAIIAKARRQA